MKIIDYIAAVRPILALRLPESVVTDLLNHTKTGVNASSDTEIKDQILKKYQEHKQLGVQYLGINAEVMKYSSKEMVRNFADMLETVVGEKDKNTITNFRFDKNFNCLLGDNYARKDN